MSRNSSDPMMYNAYVDESATVRLRNFEFSKYASTLFLVDDAISSWIEWTDEIVSMMTQKIMYAITMENRRNASWYSRLASRGLLPNEMMNVSPSAAM
ncbi:hypothetical protein OGAPHI_000654 [Ogataea philodendri]|uniref:Uncharacterized protein n=1 Tax=Ogataea philodendri TaxID=1378263 RepID=A0A9P8PET3_9ASCO|nr:uncharacterized protein OGAPHI_000654 [Ogataea philodendri]KAH3670943.1 hypothetical protein OGAPHI_000654 [Ogataea philodendri]